MATTDSGLNTHHGRNTVIVTAVLGFLALFSVFLRIWSRKMRRLSLAVDDYLVMGAMVDWLSIDTAESETLICCVRFWSLSRSSYVISVGYTCFK